METTILNKVIERNDYARLSEELNNRVQELTEVVRNKMDNLEIDRLHVNGVYYKICEVRANSGIRGYFLAICYAYDDTYKSLEHTGEFYFMNDFNCKVISADNKHKLTFLNDVDKILNLLDSLETSKCNEIKEALSNTAEY